MEEINTNQTPVSQPNISDLPVQNNKNIYKYLFIGSTFLILGIIIVFYFYLKSKIYELPSFSTSTPIPTQTEIDQKNIVKNETTPTRIPTTKYIESTLAEYNADNYLYTNNKFGFSLIVPKLTLSTIECKKEVDSDRPAIGLASVKFFENNETIYLAADNFSRLTGSLKTIDGKNTSSGYGCEKLKTNFELIEKDKRFWDYISSLKIYATNIKNDNELESYLKSKYGLCSKLEEKTSSSNDTYSVKILGDGKGLESKCPHNFAIVTEYNPTKGKLVIFELGQACNLRKDYTGGCDDLEIIKSFKFI